MSARRTVILLGFALPLLVFPFRSVLADSLDDRTKVAQAATALVSTYESRRPDNVLKLVSSRFVNPVGLEQALRDEYDKYHSIEVLSRVGPVVAGEDSASARVKWYRKRIAHATGAQEKAEGDVTLYFGLEGGVYKLLRVEGESFLPTSREGLYQKFRRVR